MRDAGTLTDCYMSKTNDDIPQSRVNVLLMGHEHRMYVSILGRLVFQVILIGQCYEGYSVLVQDPNRKPSVQEVRILEHVTIYCDTNVLRY